MPESGALRAGETGGVDAWSQRLAQAKHVAARSKQDLAEIEKQTEQLLNRIVETDNPSIIRAYETKLAKLEKNKLIVAEKLTSKGQPSQGFDEMIDLALAFLSSPWKIWASGQSR